jgi:hypothetical protein
MPVNMMVRKSVSDGFVMPAIYAGFTLLPTWIWLYFKGHDLIALFLQSAASILVGVAMLLMIGWILVIVLGRTVWRQWKYRNLPIIDMDDGRMSYRDSREPDFQRICYKDIRRVYLERSQETRILAIEFMPIGPMNSLHSIKIDLTNVDAQAEDVCDAIASRITGPNDQTSAAALQWPTLIQVYDVPDNIDHPHFE